MSGLRTLIPRKPPRHYENVYDAFIIMMQSGIKTSTKWTRTLTSWNLVALAKERMLRSIGHFRPNGCGWILNA